MKKVIMFFLLLVCLNTGLVGAATHTLTMANAVSEDHTHSQVLIYFAEKLEEYSKGEVEVIFYFDGVLGNEREVREQLQLGNIDMTRTSHAVLQGVVPEISVVGLPFLFNDLDQMYALLEGEMGDKLGDKLAEKGIKLLGWYDYGARHIISTRPIRTIQDMEGLRIRVEEDPLKVRAFRSLGASPIQLPFTDQYEGLNTGIIDGADNATEAIYTMRLYEVANYYALVAHTISPAAFYMSYKVWESLPVDIQNNILEAATSSVEWIKENQAAVIQRTLDSLNEYGMTIIEITGTDREAFREKVLPVLQEYKEMYPDLLGDLVD